MYRYTYRNPEFFFPVEISPILRYITSVPKPFVFLKFSRFTYTINEADQRDNSPRRDVLFWLGYKSSERSCKTE